MKLQEKIIYKYRRLFPNETLRETSARTGIQITRVFRLFNGRNMKVGELEAFEKVMNAKLAENPAHARLNAALEEASILLTNSELSRLEQFISRKVVAKNYSRSYIKLNQKSAIIA